MHVLKRTSVNNFKFFLSIKIKIRDLLNIERVFIDSCFHSLQKNIALSLMIFSSGPPSGASSGTTSPAWRSPKSERRRPPDMPMGVNIR